MYLLGMNLVIIFPLSLWLLKQTEYVFLSTTHSNRSSEKQVSHMVHAASFSKRSGPIPAKGKLPSTGHVYVKSINNALPPPVSISIRMSIKILLSLARLYIAKYILSRSLLQSATDLLLMPDIAASPIQTLRIVFRL